MLLDHAMKLAKQLASATGKIKLMELIDMKDSRRKNKDATLNNVKVSDELGVNFFYFNS